jgi:hypothetical protein
MVPDTVVVLRESAPGGWTELFKTAIPAIGLLGTFFTVLFGVRQYRRAETWRRGEFAAKELKVFRDDPSVDLVQTLIDWGSRRVNLYLRDDPNDEDLVLVTRGLQWRALVPHPLKPQYLARTQSPPHGEDEDDPLAWFTPDEARIRDIYDDFLYHLERFSHFIESGLLAPHELRPYLRYWIEEIASVNNEAGDAKWRCALITFIWYYRYHGVVKLCAALGHPIDREGPCWQSIEKALGHTELYRDLVKSVGSRTDPKPRLR